MQVIEPIELRAVLNIKHKVTEGAVGVINLVSARLFAFLPMPHIYVRGTYINTIVRHALDEQPVGLVVVIEIRYGTALVAPLMHMLYQWPEGELTLTLIQLVAPLAQRFIGLDELIRVTIQRHHHEIRLAHGDGSHAGVKAGIKIPFVHQPP